MPFSSSWESWNSATAQLLHHLRYLSDATVHVDPPPSGREHHRVESRRHDDLPRHSL